MSGNSNAIVCFVAGEVIQSGTDIEIRTSQPVDIKSARNSVLIRQNGKNVIAPLTIDKRGELIKVSTKNLEFGDFEFHLHELIDVKGKELVGHRIIPFQIGKFKGRIPADVRVQHVTHLALGEVGTRRLSPSEDAAKEFKYVEFVKGVHRTNENVLDLAFDDNGEEVDGRALLAEVDKRRFSKYGFLHPKLFNKLEKCEEGEPIDIAVWPLSKVDLTGYKKPTTGEIKEVPAAAKKLLKEAAHEKNVVIGSLKAVGAKIKDDRDATPFVHATLTTAQLSKLSKTQGIGRIFLDEQTGVDDLTNSEAVARVPQAHALGYTGAGVRVAVFERGPDDETNLSIAGRQHPAPATSSHSRLTHGIIKNIEPDKPHGYAPDCSLYSANSYNNDSLSWAVSQFCTVISQSFHRSLIGDGPGNDEEFSGVFSLDDHLKDHIATQFPFPTIVHAAGNGADTEFVNHKGYNTISVGNHDDFATAMSPSTIYRNPSSAHGDRELPEIAANGTAVTAVGLTSSGTSFSAPAVAGVVAVIQSVNGSLKSYPEACRAILFASADRSTVSGGTWVNDLGKKLDQSDGAGALNAQIAVMIAQQRKARNDPAVPRGFDLGSLDSFDFGGGNLSNFRYRVQVPPRGIIQLPFVYTIKVALAWNGKVSVDAAGVQTSALTVDLDLVVYDSNGITVASSASWDNSYEIVEFKGNAGEAYDIAIRRWSGTDLVWYGLAWNVTSKLAFTPPVLAGLE